MGASDEGTVDRVWGRIGSIGHEVTSGRRLELHGVQTRRMGEEQRSDKARWSVECRNDRIDDGEGGLM